MKKNLFGGLFRKERERVKLFTHTDLDGVGCGIVARHAFGADADVEYLDYHEVDSRITRFVESGEHKKYNRIYVTDVTPKPATAEVLDRIRKKVRVIDHHPTSQYLKKYNWAKVIIKRDGKKESATSLFLEELKPSRRRLHRLDSLAEEVRRWDTWEWDAVGDMTAKALNDLLYLLGRDRFIERFSQNPTLKWDKTEALLLETEQRREKEYIEKKEGEMIRRKVLQKYQVGIVFAENYISRTGNILAKRNPDLDFIILLTPPKAISFRGIKKDIHLGEFAKLFGGGGHPQASGCLMPKEAVEKFIQMVFKGDE